MTTIRVPWLLLSAAAFTGAICAEAVQHEWAWRIGWACCCCARSSART